MKSYRPRALIAAAALAALTPVTGCSNPAYEAADADLAAAPFVQCRERPGMFFAGAKPALGCGASGEAYMLENHAMVVAFGPGTSEQVPLVVTTAVRADDGQRYCIAQANVIEITDAQGPHSRVLTMYAMIDSAARLADIQAGREPANAEATDDWRNLPSDLSCRAGLEDRSNIALNRVVLAIATANAGPATPV